MTFLSKWILRPEMHNDAAKRFLETGGTPPDGIKTIGRWHYADGSGGIHVFECDDANLIREFTARWGDLLGLEIRPLVDDASAASAMRKGSGAK
jgi:hypothetical protein